MNKILLLFKKSYDLIILPLILLSLFYFTLVVPISNGNIIKTILEPWSIAILLMIISHVYVERLFVTPRNVIVNSLNVFLIAFLLYKESQEIFWIASIYSSFVFLLGLVSLIFYEKYRKINYIMKIIAKLGKAKVIFIIIPLLTFISFSINNRLIRVKFDYLDIGYLLIFYFLFLVFTRKNIIEFTKNLPLKLLNFLKGENIGIVRSNIWPNIILADFKTTNKVKINDLVLIGNNKTWMEKEINDEVDNRVGLILDFIGGQSEEDIVTARMYLLSEPQRFLNEEKSGLIKINGECRKIDNPEEFIKKTNNKKIKYYWKRRNDIIALVAPESNINILRGNIIRHQELENAYVISVINKDVARPIRYQVIEGETKKDYEAEEAKSGRTQLVAYQLGEWKRSSEEKKINPQRFFEFQWVPHINSLIFQWNKDIDEINIADSKIDEPGYYCLGTIPKTNLPIYLKIKDLVSHHTAVLGVTGTGKTTMVFKLLKEIVVNDIFTLCIDITGEYRNKLIDAEDFFDENTKQAWDIEIQKIINERKKLQIRAINQDNYDKIERICAKQINYIVGKRIGALRSLKKIIILEIPEISNTRFSLEFTQYAIQAILTYAKKIYLDNLAKEEKDKDKFQCCLVLEEAHTLIPENTGISGDFGASKAVIDKISQVALQGRKYNVGFILVSQRTATVKKTVLNQCNTMIAFRAYDETSFNFLTSYFGEEYVRKITHLKNDGKSRHVIVAGKSVVADRPIIVNVKEN